MLLRNNQFILLIILFNIIISYNNESMLIFPFKIFGLASLNNLKDHKNNEIYDSFKFFKDHYSIRMFTPMQIGYPQQDIIAFINFNHNNLLIGELLQIPNKIYPNSFYKGYKYNKSFSFKNITNQNITKNINSKTFICEEKLFLFTKIKDIDKNIYTCFSDFKFTIEKNIKNNNNSLYGLILGLKFDDTDYETNFLKQIKDRIISSNIISFEFTKENEGLLIIGKYPHEYFSEKYKEENLKTIYLNQPKDLFLTNFLVNFYEIYSSINNQKIEIQKYTKGYIFLDMGVAIGVREYRDFIEKYFFNEYINMNICQKNHTEYDYDIFIIYSCNNDEKFNLEKFPSLNFNVKSENVNFEFPYKDLFKKIDNKYYFLVIFQNFDVGYWCIGKPFYLKYTLAYNGDAKTIGFYNKNNINAKKRNKELLFKLNSFKIIIIIILFLVFIFLVIWISYYFGKKLNIIRKRHANELDDNYEYYSYTDKYKIFAKAINGNNFNENKEKQIELISQKKMRIFKYNIYRFFQ